MIKRDDVESGKVSLAEVTTGKRMPLVHPGEILKSEFLEPLGVTPYRVAMEVDVPAPRINDIVLGKRGITADTALRLGRYFGNSAAFWINLQSAYDLNKTRRGIEAELDNIHALEAA